MEQELLSRRAILVGGLLAGGGLVLGLRLPTRARAGDNIVGFVPNAFVRIEPSGAITLIMPDAEIGQGIYTSCAMLIAEELEVGLEQIQLEHAPPTRHFTPTRCSASRRPVAAPRPAPFFCRCARPGLPHV